MRKILQLNDTYMYKYTKSITLSDTDLHSTALINMELIYT